LSEATTPGTRTVNVGCSAAPTGCSQDLQLPDRRVHRQKGIMTVDEHLAAFLTLHGHRDGAEAEVL
jgi:hypothetical protein